MKNWIQVFSVIDFISAGILLTAVVNEYIQKARIMREGIYPQFMAFSLLDGRCGVYGRRGRTCMSASVTTFVKQGDSDSAVSEEDSKTDESHT